MPAPFGVYVHPPRVRALAAALREEIIERETDATYKGWGMLGFASNGPEELLVRVGWPSRLIR